MDSYINNVAWIGQFKSKRVQRIKEFDFSFLSV